MLGEFARLCREQGIRLTVATSPLSAANLDRLKPRELEFIVEAIGKVVPVWDFGQRPPAARGEGGGEESEALAKDLWLDASHYSQAVGAMMMDRMYLTGLASDFGRLRGAP
jgi:hypothetical protein